jgi:UDPglucose--hexose-1-phosphate uridylyltransferase
MSTTPSTSRDAQEVPDSTQFFARRLQKRDGWALWLYGRAPIPANLDAPVPGPVNATRAPAANPHLRWHPLRGEWVVYAYHRQNRTFLPPPEYNPLAPTTDRANPTEPPAGHYNAAVFENKFPSFYASALGSTSAAADGGPAEGACGVVVFTQDDRASRAVGVP